MSRWAVALALLLPGAAVAGGPSYDGGTYVPIGLQLGMSGDRDGLGFTLGGEASVVRVDGAVFWTGLVAAGEYDTARETGAYALAAEAGWAFVGLEVGVAVDGQGDVGLRARALSPWIFGGLYLGYDGLDGGRMVGGLLLKWPGGFD